LVWLDSRHLKSSGRTVCMDRNKCYRGWHQCLVVGSGWWEVRPEYFVCEL
jgi:hypothetical protein